MKQFETIDAMIEARAQSTHEANLLRGGVFDSNDNRWSDIEAERRYAAKHLIYVHANHAKMVLGARLSDGALCARYIQNFGYVEFNLKEV